MSTITRIDAIPVTDPLDVADRYGSSRGLVPGRAAVLVRLETSDGVVGWGEAWGASPAVKALVDELGQALVGTPLRPSSNWLTGLLQRSYHYSSSGLHVIAASGLDIAVWDAFARTLSRPVHELLGGPTRARIACYASTGYVTPDNDLGRFRAVLQESADAGYPGVKIKVGLGRASDDERTRIARETFGPDAVVLVDFNGNYTADQAIRSLEAIRAHDVGWAEEPVTPDDHEGLRMLRACGVPLAAGEAVYTRFGFRDLIAGRLIDVVQPDVTKCGGISEARVIAHLAQTWNVRFSPHVWGGAVSQAATVQLLAGVPTYPHTDHQPEPVWFEMDRGANALRDELASVPLHRDGTDVLVPQAPGLGIEIDEKALARLRSDR
ncbi:MAG TPA: mandelate racemase/muconate lactonizing enzyme family protein [Pseudonocardia sp.]|jgi:D-galactarolactone cycloisomerase|uniref:mandelate racemase/muconate lactonizing enzyme family protein n=1 Tax=Pseudonocardia sp. TaxID=60912 RepID=UPI002B4B49A6|nr:mandelate racemase/muconate lactonizing enzyme family protein [Pseudonocardia sp.]HLU56072.1 mandelate racemase/muconate lactonizing enzyme family protein [Pseudonocardia sp.]